MAKNILLFADGTGNEGGSGGQSDAHFFANLLQNSFTVRPVRRQSIAQLGSAAHDVTQVSHLPRGTKRKECKWPNLNPCRSTP